MRQRRVVRGWTVVSVLVCMMCGMCYAVDIDTWLTSWVHEPLTRGEAIKTRKDIVQHFCRTMYAAPPFEIKKTTTRPAKTYDLRTSAYLLTLCRYGETPDDVFAPVSSEYRDAIKLAFLDTLPCGRRGAVGAMTECSFAMVSRDIMLAVYNDLISIKYVHLMGGSEEDDDPVETFANRYFPTGTLCDNYLGKDSDTPACYHPIARGLVEQTMQSLQPLLVQTRIYDWSSLSDNDAFVDAVSVRKQDHRDRFENYLFVEYMVANLFATYYGTMLRNPQFTPHVATRSIETTALLREQEIRAIARVAADLDATRIQSVALLHQIDVTYPIHIALRAYYEDVVKMRGVFAKIYTPIHQLSYLLQNVQRTNV